MSRQAIIYIIGVDHLVQYKGPLPEKIRSQFKNFLCNTIRTRSIKLAAEEFSREALVEVYQSSEGTLEKCAHEMGIEHIYCDLEDEDMKEWGIPYFAEIRDQVKLKFGLSKNHIFETDLRKKIINETTKVCRSYWQTREKFWYQKLCDRIKPHTLFICGHEHVNGFKKLLVNNNHRCEIVIPFWEKDLFSDYSALGL